MRKAIRNMTFACAVVGCILSLLWPIVDIVDGLLGFPELNHIPNWLGFILVFTICCYGFWEIKLSIATPRRFRDDRLRKARPLPFGME